MRRGRVSEAGAARDAPSLARCERSLIRGGPSLARRAPRLALLAAALLAAGVSRAAAQATAEAAEGGAANAEAAASSYTLGGSIEARPFARYAGSGESSASDYSYGQATTVGLELAAKGSRARGAASLEAALLSGTAASDAWAVAAAAQAAGLDEAGLLLSPSYAAGPAPPTLLEARVRTLYLKLDWDSFSLTAGRQVVNYQRGALWSPTDPFTELDLSGISPVRRGSDALRLVLPLDATGAFDLVAAPAQDFQKGRYAARLAGLVAGIDGAALAFRDGSSGTWNLGGDFKADLVLGLNGEALYSVPGSGAGWLRAAGGADWSFGDFIVAAEYYYNGGGIAADLNAPGAHNLYAALSWKASDFLSFSATYVDGLSAGAWLSYLGAALDAAQNASVAAYARLGYLGPSANPPWLAETGLDITIKF
jgi:hypothetical protein